MIGQTLGKYRIEERIGRGGMGTVYRATDEMLHRGVAIKVLNPDLNEPEIARRFRAEAVTVARLNHPGIATIYELFEHDGQYFMVMEFVRGQTLERLVETTGPLPAERAVDLQSQALAALAYAHMMGVIHRDLKLANLMVTESGAIKVMDFGIARVAGSEHLTTAGFMMGTPAYMAPEQVRGEEVDARTDLYAMGVVLYRLTTGKLPFKGDTPFLMAQSQVNDAPTPAHAQREGLPEWIEQIITRALAKAPSERFQTADEFRDALRRGLAGLPLDLATPAVPQELIETTVMPTWPSAPPPTTGSVARTPALAMAPTLAAPLPTTPLAAPPVPAVPAASTSTPVASPRWLQMAKTPIVMAAVAATVVLLAGGTWWWRAAHQTLGVKTPAPTAASSPAPTPPVAQPPALSPPASTPQASATPAVPAALPSPPTSKAAPVPVKQTPPPAASPTSPAPEVPDVHVAYSNVKLLTVQATNSADRDVVVNFVGGQISVVPAKSGEALFSIGYKDLVQATYVHARDPKWDPSLASPAAAKFDLPGVFHPAHHWLVLQGHTAFVILRLDDANWARVLDTLEARTGVKVSRPTTRP